MSTTLLAPVPKAERFLTHEERTATIRRIAGQMFDCDPDWISFFREVMGVGGLVRQLYRTPDEYSEFLRSEAYAEIKQMIAVLRERSRLSEAGREPTKVITVRLPASLHQSLIAEAHDCQTSMNQLCISKLLLALETPGDGHLSLVPGPLSEAG